MESQRPLRPKRPTNHRQSSSSKKVVNAARQMRPQMRKGGSRSTQHGCGCGQPQSSSAHSRRQLGAPNAGPAEVVDSPWVGKGSTALNQRWLNQLWPEGDRLHRKEWARWMQSEAGVSHAPHLVKWSVAAVIPASTCHTSHLTHLQAC